MQDEPYVPIDDVANHFSVSVSTVRAWIRNNTVPHLKVGGVYRFKISKVEEALRAIVEEAGMMPEDDRQMTINFDPEEDL
jgi:excisionase family DNA binding protein